MAHFIEMEKYHKFDNQMILEDTCRVFDDKYSIDDMKKLLK